MVATKQELGGEIEEMLTTYPGISEAAVIGAPHPEWGEVPVAYLVDQKKLSRKLVVWLMALLIFVVGIPTMLSQGAVPAFSSLPFYQGKDTLTFVSEMFSDISLPLGGMLMSIFIARKWKLENMSEEIALGNSWYKGSFLESYIRVAITWLAPILLSAFFVLIVLEKFFGFSPF